MNVTVSQQYILFLLSAAVSSTLVLFIVAASDGGVL